MGRDHAPGWRCLVTFLLIASFLAGSVIFPRLVRSQARDEAAARLVVDVDEFLQVTR